MVGGWFHIWNFKHDCDDENGDCESNVVKCCNCESNTMITIIWRKKMRGENIKCVMTKTVVKSRPATLNLSSSMSRAFTHLNIEDLKIFHNNDITAGLFSTDLPGFLQRYFLSHYCWGSHHSSCCVNSSWSPAKENTLSICWLSTIIVNIIMLTTMMILGQWNIDRNLYSGSMLSKCTWVSAVTSRPEFTTTAFI